MQETDDTASQLAQVLQRCFADLAIRDERRNEELLRVLKESSNDHMDRWIRSDFVHHGFSFVLTLSFWRLQQVLTTITPLKSQVDPETTFWNAYKNIAEEHDIEFRQKYNNDLDTSLIFAGLFSAISSAFIIEIQSDLKPDPDDITQALLRIIAHAINGSLFSGDDITLPQFQPPFWAVVVESILYASLGATLLTAFLAVLGKQWLSYYASVGTRGTIAERGRYRQRKLDGFHRWGFEPVMQALPVLLQLALLLFAVALTQYIWILHRSIGIILLALTCFGVGAYLTFVFSAIWSEYSPFRTPTSDLILRIFPSARKISHLPRWLKVRASKGWIAISRAIHSHPENHQMHPQDFTTLKSKVHTLVNPAEQRKIPLFRPDAESTEFAPAAGWALETSTDPEVVVAAANLILSTQSWPAELDVNAAIDRLRDTFIACFQLTPFPTILPSFENRAVACGKAYYYLFFHPSHRYLGFPFGFFPKLPQDWWKSCRWSPELQFVYHLLEVVNLVHHPVTCAYKRSRLGELKLTPEFLRYVADRKADKSLGAIVEVAADWTRDFEQYRRWPGWRNDLISERRMDILAQHMYFLDNSMEEMSKMEDVASELEQIGLAQCTDWLLCLGICCGLPIHVNDVAVFNKGDHFDQMSKALLNHLRSSILARNNHSPEDEQKLRISLTIILVLLVKLPPAPNVYSHLWTSIYLLVILSRSTGGLEKACSQVIAYIDRSVELGEPFIDPAFSNLAGNFRKCGILSALEKVPATMHLKSNISSWTPTETGRLILNPMAPGSEDPHAAALSVGLNGSPQRAQVERLFHKASVAWVETLEYPRSP